MSSSQAFPKDFLWGLSSSAYQMEGAATEDGRGVSVWDTFAATPGNTFEGHTGARSCDHYHHVEEDVGLMKQLGIQCYRLSTSWPRLMPEGTGRVNEKGVAFYDKLIDALLSAGIEPMITLFHWDSPQETFFRGGWLNRDMAKWFGDYAALVAERFGDRVKYWLTHNEPQCLIHLGHIRGINAPGLKLNTSDALRASHHALLSHGLAVQAIRGRAKKSIIGWAPVGVVRHPVTQDPKDIEAARAGMFAVTDRTFWNNTWFSDPVFFGHYPEDGLKLFGSDMPVFPAEDMGVISQPLDFYGVNIYSSTPTKAGPDGKWVDVARKPGHPMTAFRWWVEPESLYWGPRFMAERYKIPVMVTENGMDDIDWVGLDGQCHDPKRIDFLHRHLLALRRAIADGVDVRGYFHWTIFDNFEWVDGYKEHFGLVHVDMETLKRTPKDSYHWYKQVIASNGGIL